MLHRSSQFLRASMATGGSSNRRGDGARGMGSSPAPRSQVPPAAGSRGCRGHHRGTGIAGKLMAGWWQRPWCGRVRRRARPRRLWLLAENVRKKLDAGGSQSFDGSCLGFWVGGFFFFFGEFRFWWRTVLAFWSMVVLNMYYLDKLKWIELESFALSFTRLNFWNY